MEESKRKKVSRDLLIGAAGSILATAFLGAAGWIKGFFGLPDTIKNMENILKEIQTQNQEVQKDILSLQTDVSNLQTDMRTLKGQVSELLVFKTETEEKLSGIEGAGQNRFGGDSRDLKGSGH